MISADQLPRFRCVEMLESVGIQCYDDETTAELREAVSVNLADGTLDPAEWGARPSYNADDAADDAHQWAKEN